MVRRRQKNIHESFAFHSRSFVLRRRQKIITRNKKEIMRKQTERNRFTTPPLSHITLIKLNHFD